jgi:hypothetical protein
MFGAASLSCFGGQFLQGAQCQSDNQCGPQLQCIEGYCGGCNDCGGESETGEASNEVSADIFATPIRDIDILLVIDNSASMSRNQTNLLWSMAPFIELLENEETNANYRIAITTTDVGNPSCVAEQTTPEHGNLVLSSCEERLEDFVADGGQLDVGAVACSELCQLDAGALEILPTTTDYDAVAKPRPWLERIGGQSNLPASTDMLDAFMCFGPQGISGCEFESPLESMYLAMQRINTPADPAYGFVRRHAVLAILILTDSADCSYAPEFASIFDVDGDKTFWSDPSAAAPTPAVCWNAGVECVGDPSGYDSCSAVNKDVDGTPGVGDAEAVLHPLSRYVDMLQALEDDKKFVRDNNEIIVGLIAGVEVNGEVDYVDVSQSDPAYHDAFGIGPGCSVPDPDSPGNLFRAVPPVRLREMGDAFTPGALTSICDNDYSNVFGATVQPLIAQIRPACFPACVQDTDPATDIVEPSCVVVEDPPGDDDSFELPECLRDANGYVIDQESYDYAMPDDETNGCFALLVDSGGQTASFYDDMSLECQEQGSNLEFRISRRPGFPSASGTVHEATCIRADAPEVACPDLGD